MPAQSPAVLLIGDSRAADMQPVRSALMRRAPAADVRHAATTAAALSLLDAGDWFPDLVVVCQTWPDQFTAAEVQQLIGRAPLARWIVCYGPWCESDGRNHDVWPAAVRMPVACADARIRRELDVLHGTRTALPLTAARDERLLFDYGEPPEPLRLSVAVVGSDRELCRACRDLLHRAGCEIPPSPAVADAVLWDGDPWNDEAAERLRMLRAAHPDAVIVVLRAWMCGENKAVACGADVVASKLLPAADLLRLLSQTVCSRSLQSRPVTA